MNRKTLAFLMLAVIASVGLVFIAGRDRGGDESSREPAAAVPGLAAVINDVDELKIVGSGGETIASLHRSRQRWRLREKHDHEADFARVHDLLRNLARARRAEPRSSKAEWHARLGVAEPGSGDGSGVAVRFPGSSVGGVIVGRQDPAGIGRYIRLEGSSQVWLTDRNIEIADDRLNWLERAIMDIPAPDISAVSIGHPGAETVELRPGDENGELWVVLGVPDDMEPAAGWKLRQIADALARLNMDDVRPHDESLVPEDRVESVFRTRDGLVFVARLFSDEAGYWVHFHISSAEDEPAPGHEDSKNSATPEPPAPELDAVAADARLSPWQYRISKDRFERLTAGADDVFVGPEQTLD
ncbi:MAG TPA: DUF4340 domain-containing protein [Wenzhouxiangella sp.]|nr:DUF4340 domain-containing protein [Wenzhouxiangella sp.]